MNRAWLLALPLALTLAGCADPQGDYEDARSADTISAYSEFIDQHPEHELAGRARQRIAELREQTAWEEANQADTADAYEGFLAMYPESPRADEAEQRLQALRATSEWEALRGTEDMQGLRDFIARYPQSEQAMQARRRLEELETPPEPEPEPEPEEPPEGDFQVQLAALTSEEGAMRERDRLMSAAATVLGNVELRVEPPPAGSRLYRVRTSGLERDEADALCQELGDAGLDCFVTVRE